MQPFDKNRTQEMQRSEGEGKNVVIIDSMDGDKLMLYRKIGTNAERLDQATRKSKRKWISTTRETGTRGKREVEEVEDVQLHVWGSSKDGKSCTKQSSQLQPSDIVQSKDSTFFQGFALRERERRMLRTIMTGCSQASSRTVSDLRFIGLL